MYHALRIATFALMALAVQTAQAATVTYTSLATFQTATGATLASGSVPGSGNVGASETIGSITLNSVVGGGTEFIFADWTSRIFGNEIAVQGIESFDAQSSFLINAMGFEFVEPKTDPNVNAPFIESVFSVSVYNGATLVDSVSFSRANDSLQFFGISTDLAFNRMEIREITGGAENEFFGRFYTNAATVPLPAALPMLSLALAGLAGLRCARQRSV